MSINIGLPYKNVNPNVIKKNMFCDFLRSKIVFIPEWVYINRNIFLLSITNQEISIT